MARSTVVGCLLFGVMTFQGFALPSDSMLAGSTRLSNGLTMYFRLYVPRSYTNTKKYPVVVTLHGVGEKGVDNRIQVDREEIVRQWMLDGVQKKYAPFILCPQCPNSGSIMWSSNAGDGTIELGFDHWNCGFRMRHPAPAATSPHRCCFRYSVRSSRALSRKDSRGYFIRSGNSHEKRNPPRGI